MSLQYEVIGLENYINKNYKEPIYDYNDKSFHSKNIESRYLTKTFNYDKDELTSMVHNKIMEKLSDKIADDFVNELLTEISIAKSKNNDEVDF